MISLTNSWFFEKTNKIGKPVLNSPKKKIERQKFLINKITNEKGEIAVNTWEIQKIMNSYKSTNWTT